MEGLPFPETNGLSEKLADTGKLSKDYIDSAAIETYNKMVEGGETHMEIAIKARTAADFMTKIESINKDGLLDEIEKLHPEERHLNGVKFEVTNTPTKYSFDHDSEWTDLSEQMEDIKAKLKKREELMINALKFSEVYDDEGVKVEPAVIKSPSGTAIRMSIPKK